MNEMERTSYVAPVTTPPGMVGWENMSCEPIQKNIPSPGESGNPYTLNVMLKEVTTLADETLSAAVLINNNFFGIGPKERKSSEPKCLMDVMIMHVETMKMLCQEVEDIAKRLGV